MKHIEGVLHGFLVVSFPDSKLADLGVLALGPEFTIVTE